MSTATQCSRLTVHRRRRCSAAEVVAVLERNKHRRKKVKQNKQVMHESMLMQLVQQGVSEAAAIAQVESM